MELIDVSISWEEVSAQIDLYKYFNLYPKIRLIIDCIDKNASYYNEKDKIVRLYSSSYEVSKCATDIRYKTTLKDNCGQISFKLLDEDCQRLFHNGDRVRLYLDDRCWFCGFIFTINTSGKQSISVTAFDYLRYFKSPLSYMKSELKDEKGQAGLTASQYIRKICSDLALPCTVYDESTIPVTAQNYDMKTGFNIMQFAIEHTLINSPASAKQYYTFYHEPHSENDDKMYQDNQDMSKTQVYKTSGEIQFRNRRALTTNVVLDDTMIIDYNYERSIDKQTYNEVILYKDQKTYLSSKGKTLKKGKKTGTRIVKTANRNDLKALYGYLPYYHKCPDNYTEAQMQDVANKLQNILGRETQSLTFQCYGIPGMRAGYMIPVLLRDIAGTDIAMKSSDKDGTERWLPVYRTVKECEIQVTHPLKMNLTISSAEYGEYDL